MLELSFEKVSVDNRPDPDRLMYMAEGIQRVMRIAYSRLFEIQRSPQLPVGTVRRGLFDETRPAKVRQQAKRMSEHIERKGSNYLLGWDEDELVGLAKTSPSRSHRKSFAKSNYYLNDIAVTYEGLGFGSRILAEALSKYPQEQCVSLDAYEGNCRANDWFNGLGFEVLERQPTGIGFQIGQIIVPQVRMRAPYVGLVSERLAGRIS